MRSVEPLEVQLSEKFSGLMTTLFNMTETPKTRKRLIKKPFSKDQHFDIMRELRSCNGEKGEHDFATGLIIAAFAYVLSNESARKELIALAEEEKL